VGILAAAGLHALDHHVERLADDHARALRFARAAADAVPGSVDPQRVQTNIVVLDVATAGWTPAGFVEAAAAHGIRLYPVSTTAVRLVWHLDVDDAATDVAIDALAPLLEAGPPRAL
jgi:threonine aldolase